MVPGSTDKPRSHRSVVGARSSATTLNFAPLSCALKTKTKPITVKVTQRLFHKCESNSRSLAQTTPDNKQRFNTHSVSLARAWANEYRWVFSSNTVQRSQKQRCGFCANGKLDSSLDESPNSDPLRIKSFHSVLKLLKCFQKLQIMFGFLQKHHNSQLQSITSATAVSVMLVDHHNARWAWKSVINLSFTDDNRSNLNYAVWYVQS